MILTCPKCDTRYRVSHKASELKDKSLQCKSCGYKWEYNLKQAPPSIDHVDLHLNANNINKEAQNNILRSLIKTMSFILFIGLSLTVILIFQSRLESSEFIFKTFDKLKITSSKHKTLSNVHAVKNKDGSLSVVGFIKNKIYLATHPVLKIKLELKNSEIKVMCVKSIDKISDTHYVFKFHIPDIKIKDKIYSTKNIKNITVELLNQLETIYLCNLS